MFSPYLFAGLTYFWYDPSTQINGVDVISSEINEDTGIALAFGPGVKLNMGRKMSLNLEWGFRNTFSDNIDGLPNVVDELYEQGKDYTNDWYVITGFMLTYKITKEGPCPSMNF